MTPKDALRRYRFYPGWVMLGFSAAAQFMSAPGQSYSVSAFKLPMQESLAISETALSYAYGVATIGSGLALPWIGRQVDKYGARIILPIVSVLLACACFGMSRVEQLPQLYLGFAAIRCLGQGAMWLIGTWIVGEWFLRKRGFATAISGLGSSLSVIVFPELNLHLISNYGWRTAWQILGILVVTTMVLPVIVFFRDCPEQLGLLPDGWEPNNERQDEVTENQRERVTDDSWTLSEVLRNATFWKLLSVGVTTGMIGTGLVFHQETILAAHGISKTFAMRLISLQATVGTIATFAMGWLTDRYPADRLLALGMFMLSLAVACLYWMPHWSWACLYAVLVGLLGAILRTAGTVVWVNYYGRQNQGVIRGAANSGMILAAAVGPLPLAMANDYFHSYQSALLAFMLIPLVSMAWVATATVPTRSR